MLTAPLPSLAILKINGEELLATTDDGAFIKCADSHPNSMSSLTPSSFSTMKAYFASLGESAHPHAADSRTRQITKFQELRTF